MNTLLTMPVVPSPAVDDFLRQISTLSKTKTPVAVFDCDGTVIKGDIGEAMFYYQLEHFLLRVNPANIWLDHPKREELDNLYTQLAALPADRRTQDRRYVSFAEMMLGWYFDQLSEGKTEKACTDIVKLLSKFNEQEVRQIAASTFEKEFSTPRSFTRFGKYSVPRGIRYINESVSLLEQFKNSGFDVWAISGSNKWSILPIFERLGIPSDHIIGIELQFSGNVLSTKIQTPVPILHGKVEALQQFIEYSPAVVVSDSIYDLPLFNYSSGKKIFVNSRMETSYTFFKQANIVQDESWIVIEKPTPKEIENDG